MKNQYFCDKHDGLKNKWKPYNINHRFTVIRDNVMVKNANLPQNEKWLINTPCDTRQLILKDLSTACKSALTNKK